MSDPVALDRSTPSVESADGFLYRLKCAIEPLFDINDGGGWQRADDEFERWMSNFSHQEQLESLHRAVHETDGQNLALHCKNPDVARIDVVIVEPTSAQFFVHFSKQPTAQALEAFHGDFQRQVAGGWGEAFEQVHFGLQTTDTYGTLYGDPEIEIQCGFRFLSKSLTVPVTYDPKVMFSLDELEKARQRDGGVPRHRP